MSAEEPEYFFSYARDDADFVLKLAQELRAEGIDLWVDQLDITGGQRWDRAVEKALAHCHGMIVVLSPVSVASKNVMDEVSYALEENKLVVPVLLKDCDIPFRLRRVQRIDFTADYDTGFTHLLRALRIEQSEPTPAPAAFEAADEALAAAEVTPSAAPRQSQSPITTEPHASEAKKAKPEPQKQDSDQPAARLEPWFKEPKRLALLAAGGIVFVLMLIFALSGSDPAPVVSIAITPPEATIEVDKTRELTATLMDSQKNELSGRPVTWTSSNPSVASVDASGVVTGLNEGSATITATSESVEGSTTVNVSPAPRPLPAIAFTSIPERSWSIGTYEVTQGQWKAVMGTEPWQGGANVREGDDYPAMYVSWDDAQAFIAKLNAQDNRYRYRLPTEAEWEYACRAGSTTEYSFAGDARQLGDYAWYDANTVKVDEPYAHRVGQKKANGWGLYDMHGNVWEWMETQTQYQGTLHRVIRGGSFIYSAEFLRSAYRGSTVPDAHDGTIGFRVVRMAR